MCLKPQRASRDDRIDPGFAPPRRFITAAVNLAMVTSTQWNGELVADLAPKCPALRESEMMGVCRQAAANETRMPGNEFDMMLVANAPRLRPGQRTFVDTL
jgi:hypothetical protein